VILDTKDQAKASKIKVVEKSQNNKSTDGEIKLTESNEKNVYTFEYYASPDAVLELTPVCTSTEYDKLLFYPISRKISVGHRCISDPKEIKFEARQGLVLSGHVEGNVTDVSVVVKVKGTDKVVHEEVSKSGKYKIGPLYDDQQYEVSVSKHGYNIFPHPDKHGVFVSEILSYLTITFIDEATKKPIPSVLVAVSSGRSYRNSTYSNENGVVEFPDLYSGKYYIRPMLKEFEFESASFDIKEGETVKKTLKAKRVAFSAFGSVTLISGDPVSKVVVQARSVEESHVEEATTDNNGQYRLKGLKKEQTYEISVKSNVSEGQQQVRKAMPAARQITVGESDSQDINFSVLLPTNKFYLKGVVDIEDDDWQSEGGKIEVYIKGKLDNPVSRQKIGPSRIFTFTGLPVNMDYVLRVTPKKEHAKLYGTFEREIDLEELRKDSSKDSVFVRATLKKNTQ
jgi:hypothetical protein